MKDDFDEFLSLRLRNSVRLMRKRIGPANKTSPRFYPGQTSAAFPRYLKGSGQSILIFLHFFTKIKNMAGQPTF